MMLLIPDQTKGELQILFVLKDSGYEEWNQVEKCEFKIFDPIIARVVKLI